MEPIDLVGQPDGGAQLDDLLRVEVTGQVAVELVGDRLQPGRRLGVADDRRLFGRVDAIGQRIVVQMGDLLVGQPHAPTEQDVGRDSVVAAVDDGRGEVRQLALGGRDQRSGPVGDLGPVAQHAGMVRHRPQHVRRTERGAREALEDLPGRRIGVGIAEIDERDPGHHADGSTGSSSTALSSAPRGVQLATTRTASARYVAEAAVARTMARPKMSCVIPSTATGGGRRRSQTAWITTTTATATNAAPGTTPAP